MTNNSNRHHKRNNTILVLLIINLTALGIFMYKYFYPLKTGPEQPIAFSHRVHAEKKDISCFFCHNSAVDGARAGIPALETCMLCHRQVITHHPEIEKLYTYYNAKKPVEWVKVADVPDYTFFNHGVHMHRKVDCAECHGNVKEMDRVEKVYELEMGFCIECHKEQGATTDCFTCHR